MPNARFTTCSVKPPLIQFIRSGKRITKIIRELPVRFPTKTMKASGRSIVLVVFATLIGCNKQDPTILSAAKDPVAVTLGDWTKTRDTSDSEKAIAETAAKALVQARDHRVPGLYCFAAQMHSTQGDLKSAKAILDEAIMFFPDLDGPRLMMSELYFRLAFFAFLRGGQISVSAVPTADVQPSNIQNGYVGDDIEEFVAGGRPKAFRDALSRAGFDRKSMGAVGVYLISFKRASLDPELEKLLPELIEKAGKPTYLPMVKWSPLARDTELLRLAHSEMQAARNAKRMAEHNPRVRVIDRANFDRLARRLEELTGISTTLEPSQKAAIRELLQLTRTIRDNDSPLSKDPSWLQDAADRNRAELILATSYIVDDDYEKGVEEFTRLCGTARKEVEVEAHFSLGDAYYDLALLDMMSRRLFTQNRMGFILLQPDTRTKLVLAAANNEFALGISQGGGLPDRSKGRTKQLDCYLHDIPAHAALTIDQAKCARWLLNLSKKRPEFVEASRRTLTTYRWLMLLQNDPPLLAPTPFILEARKKRMAQIDTECGDYGFRIKGIYYLACMTSRWVSMSTLYSIVAKKDPQDKNLESLKKLGKDILEAADLLDLALPTEAKALLSMDVKPNGFETLLTSLESGLQINYSPRCRLLYILIYSDCFLADYSSSEEMITFIGRRAIPQLVPRLAHTARDAGAEEATQKEILAVSSQEVTPATADKVTVITSRIFTKILADIKQMDRWHQ